MDADRDPVFPVQQMPSLLFPPPPPRPLSLDSSSSLSSSSFVSHHPSITSFPILVLTVLGILTTSVLLLTYYIFVIRCCLNWHSSSSSDTPVTGLISRRRRGTVPSGLPTVAEPRGLEEAAIQSLPAFRYRKALKKDTADSSECAVCISEFQEEERVRLLPSCLHVFHVDCIDTWLQGNANCPLCRAAIATNNSQLPWDHLLRPEEVVIQVITGAEDEGDQVQLLEANTAGSDPAGDATTDQQVISKKRKNQDASHVSISKGDECIVERRDREVLPLRRSFSMDSLGCAGEVHLQVQNILQKSTQFHGDISDSSSTITL
ncbi:RING-H2 finger protein ATL1-like [Oryza brachyantha]|uniref:RING-type E3 ubiquitin transferase n=1 Tax=Oryza brachyantha TaxID=4533 RepID=J3LIG3_ORYBR|nr:RING-H2 finger protein ATL1-like [Oryza brachyantha]